MDNREAISQLESLNKEVCIYSEAIALAIAALEQQEKDRWTPVAENPKKPKYQFDTYLVYTKYERFGIADYFVDGSWIGYDIDGDQIDGDEIIAWRPLPEKYKAEEGAE